jgi:high-affinity nickel permease
MFELVSFAMLAILIGVRHGFDADHIAAIADMVGAENKRRKQVQLGVMYAVGHGTIVLVIGILAIMIGAQFSEGTLFFMESLVGGTLIVLGGVIIYSILRQKSNYEYKSRFSIMYESIAKLVTKKGDKGRKISPITMGVLGAFLIGSIHGIGAETPTQVTIITSAVGLDNVSAAFIQLLLFVLGLLVSTILITFLASWGFMKAQMKKKVYLVLGSVTGVYSIALGSSIIYGL